MSEDKNKIEKELRANKIELIKSYAEQLVQLKFNEFKDYKVEDDKPLPYYDATIDILKKQVANAKLGEPKIIKFDKTEQERANLTPEQLKQLEEEQRKMNERIDTFFATLSPRDTLRGNLQAPGAIILRYRGEGIDTEYLQKHPYGEVL